MTEEQVDRLIAALERIGAVAERLAPMPAYQPVRPTNGPVAYCGRCGTPIALGTKHVCSGINYSSPAQGGSTLRLA